MKKLIILTCLFATLSVAASNPPEVSEKVLKAFNQTFMRQVLNNPKLYQEQFMMHRETCLEQPGIIHRKTFRSIY